jgi:Fe-S cluster biogenesis protein NfuA
MSRRGATSSCVEVGTAPGALPAQSTPRPSGELLLHAEAGAAADEVRWVMPGRVLARIASCAGGWGALTVMPAPLQALCDEGTLRDVRLAADALVTRWGAMPGEGARAVAGRSTTDVSAVGDVSAAAAARSVGAERRQRDREGARVEAAVRASVADHRAAWRVRATGEGDVLEQVRTLVDGPVAAMLRRHGGRIRLLGVTESAGGIDVRVRLGGTCRGCPVAQLDLTGRVRRMLRRECPQVRRVTAG